ncbi:hypothetical protein ACK3TF_004841 [Chlorella vulgaris]
MAAHLQEFFERCGENVDSEVIDYCTALLADDTDPDELRDTLTGFAPTFGALPLNAQQQQVSELLQQAQEVEQATHTSLPVPPASNTTNIAKAGVKLELGSFSFSNVNAEDAHAGGMQQQQQPSQQQQQQAVSSLRDMFGALDDGFLAHVLASKGGGSLQEAATWMLECEDLPAAQEAWQHSLQRAQDEQQQEAVAQAQAKKLIVQRFLLQPVPNGSDGDGKGRPPPLKAWGAGSSGESKCKARYREGAVVTSRGEKYIIEKQGEEWDGGSRGKVVSKGKRGKGFY